MKNLEKFKKYSSNLKVLYVEDNKEFVEYVREILENFFSLVDIAVNGEDGLNKYIDYFNINDNYYDMVITDICMPRINGLELTKKIYKLNSNQPIIVISAHDESKYLLEFISIGIEHFIVKPFNLDEIVNVLYNSLVKINNTNTELINNFVWNPKDIVLLYKNKNIKLTKKEMLFIQILIKNGNSISTIDEILNKLWDDILCETSTETLNPVISRLRKKLPEKLIKSVYGIGYKLYSKDDQ